MELGIPFRFNSVLSLKAIPQYVDIAKLAVSTGALAVNFLAFNPFEGQATGHRSTINVPSYGDVATELNKALDVLAAGGVEANVRYFPACMVEERHRKSMYNFQQLSYDAHEWDYDSWSWTGQQPQRMKWGEPSEHHSDLAALTYSSWVFQNPEENGQSGLLPRVRASVKDMLAPFPATRETVKRAYWSALAYRRKLRNLVTGNGHDEDATTTTDELHRDPDVYRDHAVVRALDHCHYQYAPQCDECDVKAICDGFHGDYAALFGSDEARPIHLGRKVTDPLYYIKEQVKISTSPRKPRGRSSARACSPRTPARRRGSPSRRRRHVVREPPGPATAGAPGSRRSAGDRRRHRARLRRLRRRLPAVGPGADLRALRVHRRRRLLERPHAGGSRHTAARVAGLAVPLRPSAAEPPFAQAQVEGSATARARLNESSSTPTTFLPDVHRRHLFVHHNIETAVAFTSSNQWTIAQDGRSSQSPIRQPHVYLSEGSIWK